MQQNAIEWRNSLGELLTSIELVFDTPTPNLTSTGYGHLRGYPTIQFDGSTLAWPNMQGWVKCEHTDGNNVLMWAFKTPKGYGLD